jgi:hypothetical protein
LTARKGAIEATLEGFCWRASWPAARRRFVVFLLVESWLVGGERREEAEGCEREDEVFFFSFSAVDRVRIFFFSFAIFELFFSPPQCSLPKFQSLSPYLTLPIAESTITGRCSGKEHTMSATSRILVASATDEPPNL